ncbi:MAG: lipopolysaccharide biosynthesis protein, partial [Oscillospiraceae bacterium]|nr:lipopolysaccharide biosynthesis protein [Candidatus Equicaccousia limihippi]
MNKSKVVFSNLMWRFFERCGAQGVSFIVSLVLARILMPEMYGTVALMNVVINLLTIFISSGMGAALVQKKNADDLDFSSMFYFNIVMCCTLYAVLFFCAPAIADFYKTPEMTAYLRVIGITLIISGVKNIQSSYVSRNLMFKRFFFATLGGTIGAGVIGIAMALSGFGVWALITQSLFNNFVDTVILWITVKWRPKKMFSFKRLGGLFSYGWKLLVSAFLDTGYREVRTLIIGKVYNSTDLAYYNKGESFPKLLVDNINSAITSVLFPVMSKEQDNAENMKLIIKRSITVSCYLLAPLIMGMFAVAPVLIRVLLTDKWAFCVPYLQVFCIVYLMYPLHTANLNAVRAVGRSDLFLVLEIAKKVIGISALIIAIPYGVFAIAISVLLSDVVALIINSYVNHRLFKYGFLKQMRDI